MGCRINEGSEGALVFIIDSDDIIINDNGKHFPSRP
jgi:hypothetical protein